MLSGKKQKPFFYRRSFLQFSNEAKYIEKEEPSIQHRSVQYQKPFFNRRFFFDFIYYNTKKL